MALRAAVADAPFSFVVGKGGVGKTTIAAALSLELSGDDAHVHLISTDPAHSLRDVLTHDIPATLTVEEFDANAYADSWLERARGSLTELIERGTYLDGDDVAAFTRLALPGIDELMAALRLAELAGHSSNRQRRFVIVDTAPTGHTLRLLDAAHTLDGIARALRAMADKAAVVASSFAGRAVRLRAEALVDELEDHARRYRNDVLRRAHVIVAARPGAVVEAETQRLYAALRERGLQISATVWTGAAPADAKGAGLCFTAPLFAQPPRGAIALRAWSDAVTPCNAAPAADILPAPTHDQAAPHQPALAWLAYRSRRLWLVAGKGGVGKTTCAAALALALADTQDVLLCSADPAGSLADVLDTGATHISPRLRVRQIDPAGELARLRELYRTQVIETLDSIGLSEAALLDRRVIESLWELAPPGIDEIAALVAMLDVAETNETVVLDTAPTGHFLRLLAMPELARDWTHQLMRLLVKYGAAGSDGAAEALLRLARELRALLELLHDAQRAGILLVTLDEPVVQAETVRLLRQLRVLALPVVAIIVNRTRDFTDAGDEAVIVAPEMQPSPVGVAALREFAASWKIVA